MKTMTQKFTYILSIAVALITSGVCEARTQRSHEAIAAFKATNPCPANGNREGLCPGYIIDHITPLACGGSDQPGNMQWQSEAEAKAKDKWERKGCSKTSSGTDNGTQRSWGADTAPGEYRTGPRGGCFTYTSSGRKRYVDHSFCG